MKGCRRGAGFKADADASFTSIQETGSQQQAVLFVWWHTGFTGQSWIWAESPNGLLINTSSYTRVLVWNWRLLPCVSSVKPVGCRMYQAHSLDIDTRREMKIVTLVTVMHKITLILGVGFTVGKWRLYCWSTETGRSRLLKSCCWCVKKAGRRNLGVPASEACREWRKSHEALEGVTPGAGVMKASSPGGGTCTRRRRINSNSVPRASRKE